MLYNQANMESNNPLEQSEEKEELFEELAHLLYLKQDPTKKDLLTDKGKARIDDFLRQASESEKAEVERRAGMKRKASLYTNRNTSRRELEKIEKEMAENPKLQEYIEKTWASKLAKNYVHWQLASEFNQEFDQKRFEMNEKEINKLFEFLGKYREEMEEGLVEASTPVMLEGEVEEETPDFETAYTYLGFLKNMKAYIKGSLNTREKENLDEAIISSRALQKIYGILSKN